jgi:2'-5' RNA ligase
VRLFLAINIEADLRHAITDATASLREEAPALSWVSVDRLHLTLKFLGEQPENSTRALADSATEAAHRHRTFMMRLGEIGAFPNFRRARVVWMGVDHDAKLELLHHDLEVACERRGFEVDGRPFRPHVTLARVRERTAPDELKRLARAAGKIRFKGEAMVTSIDVMQSVTSASDKRYQRLHAAPLRDA